MSLRCVGRSSLWPRSAGFTASFLALQAAVFDETPAARDHLPAGTPPPVLSRDAHQQVWRLAQAPRRIDRYHARLATTLARLMAAMGWPDVHLLGLARDVAWDADARPVRRLHPPLARALQQQNTLGVPDGFTGGLLFDASDCASVVPIWFWLARCSSAQHSLHFGADGQDFMGSLCQHGNLHLDIAGADLAQRLAAAAVGCGLEAVPGVCQEAFGAAANSSGAARTTISGRGLVL